MAADPLQAAIAEVPPGAWAVGVSGGADSVALLWLLHQYRASDLSLHVVHLDHQTRGSASTGDAAFVQALAASLQLPATIRRRDEIEPSLKDPPANASALYRALRLELFRQEVESNQLRGVILAHHADDQAETVLHRLLRGSGYQGLAGMARESVVGELSLLRPMLSITRAMLREYLGIRGISWREDASNELDDYLRNRLRKELSGAEELHDSLIELGEACRGLRDWTKSAAPTLEEEFPVSRLANLPSMLAEESAKRWLIESAKVPPEELSPPVVARLIEMSRDAATPPRQDFPVGATLHRKRGIIRATRKSLPASTTGTPGED